MEVKVLTYYAVPFPINPALFRLLRIGKLARALRMLPVTNALASLQLLVKGLTASRGMLFWSFCLLTFLQCVAGMVVSTLVRDFVTDENQPNNEREEVFRYYGTFTRTFLSMFEILFANWGPPCRVLVEYVGEYYSIFFLLYRCVLGFAVINVVNAIFVQQTLKTASSDEELAFKNKEKDIALYANKVKKLFQTMDFSGDGAINLEEFSKLVKSPKLKFWMSQLELEYHDLLSLFEFLDNGDGEITLTEFIEGAARLRGGAKALDIWRMETKLEVLFEEVLTILNFIKGGAMIPNDPSISVVQDVFNNSLFKHIQSTARGRQRSAE
ncbi:Catsper1 [Symbiodinium sp. CCMP2592]|nr:Catsper1 [Symbiodinium sp. CCMP2592]